MSHHWNVGQNRDLLIADKSFANMAKFRYWELQQQIKTAFVKKLRAH
jgi:hypothetical protein